MSQGDESTKTYVQESIKTFETCPNVAAICYGSVVCGLCNINKQTKLFEVTDENLAEDGYVSRAEWKEDFLGDAGVNVQAEVDFREFGVDDTNTVCKGQFLTPACKGIFAMEFITAKTDQ